RAAACGGSVVSRRLRLPPVTRPGRHPGVAVSTGPRPLARSEHDAALPQGARTAALERAVNVGGRIDLAEMHQHEGFVPERVGPLEQLIEVDVTARLTRRDVLALVE